MNFAFHHAATSRRAKSFHACVAIAAATLLLQWTPSISAHDAWIEPVAGPEYPVHYGHKETLPYLASKVKEVHAYDAQGQAIAAVLTRSEGVASVRPAARPAMMALHFDNGYFVRVDGKSRNVGKREAPEATSSSRPLKWSKTILQWTDAAYRPIGQRIEFVPLPPANRSAAAPPKAGEPLEVLVLMDGQPLAGAEIESNRSDERWKTDAQGRATVVTSPGSQRLSVEKRMPTVDDPDADVLALNASLVFEAR